MDKADLSSIDPTLDACCHREVRKKAGLAMFDVTVYIYIYIYIYIYRCFLIHTFQRQTFVFSASCMMIHIYLFYMIHSCIHSFIHSLNIMQCKSCKCDSFIHSNVYGTDTVRKKEIDKKMPWRQHYDDTIVLHSPNAVSAI